MDYESRMTEEEKSAVRSIQEKMSHYLSINQIVEILMELHIKGELRSA